MDSVILKAGKDKAVRNRHHWIFSGAVARFPDFEDGDILAVRSSGGEHLGYAYFNRRGSIVGRVVGFGAPAPRDAVRKSLAGALALREGLFDPAVTNARRLVNAEGDGLPGLVADLYDDVLVVQIATLGMEKLKPLLLELLVEALRPRTVYERSDLPARREEGLGDLESVLYGDPAGAEQVDVLENGLPFRVRPSRSQKTGFYLDQREMRALVRRMAGGSKVLNAFSYTGAFTVCALKGGAVRADSVDSSEAALGLAEENLELNGLPASSGSFVAADVFSFLRSPNLDYDFIILDPPAFAKRRTDVVQACRGYKDINRLAIQKVRPGGLVLTFSCSHFIDPRLFRQVVFQASLEAGRRVRILQEHRQAFDHPVSVYHPETAYLKGLLLHVE